MSRPEFIQRGFEKALAHVVEEAGEVLAAAGKIGRFGPFSSNPLLPPDQRETNINWLLREVTDLEGALERLRASLPGDFGGQS